MTGDRDLFQLVRDDKPVRVIYSVEKYAPIDEAAMTRKFGVPGRAYASTPCCAATPATGCRGARRRGEVRGGPGQTPSAPSPRCSPPSTPGAPTASLPGRVTKLAAARDYLAVAPAVVQVVRDVRSPLRSVE